ncbi:MAG: DUF5615 family PIN-like protein [Fimbriimonas sp.]|nr:DUF5615 family PIN-like protein [Fimbriimonas sp.]
MDQGLPRDAAVLIRERSWLCEHVGELGLARAEDSKIVELAVRTGSVVVTIDADFHAMISVSGAVGPSVIRIRIEGLSATEVADLLERVIDLHGDELPAGALVSMKPTRTTIRKLPI